LPFSSHGHVTYICVYFLHQLSRVVDKVPDHGSKVLDALGLARLRQRGLIGKGRRCGGVAGLGRSQGGHVAARLENRAAGAVQDDARLDAGLLSQPAQLLVEGIVPVCLQCRLERSPTTTGSVRGTHSGDVDHVDCLFTLEGATGTRAQAGCHSCLH